MLDSRLRGDDTKYSRHSPCFVSLLCFFVNGSLHAPIAKLLEFNLALNFFLVLFAPVIGALADCAGKFDKAVLAHD